MGGLNVASINSKEYISYLLIVSVPSPVVERRVFTGMKKLCLAGYSLPLAERKRSIAAFRFQFLQTTKMAKIAKTHEGNRILLKMLIYLECNTMFYFPMYTIALY